MMKIKSDNNEKLDLDSVHMDRTTMVTHKIIKILTNKNIRITCLPIHISKYIISIA